MKENQAASTRAPQEAPRALLLDDNLMSALRLRRQLQLLGYEVEERRDLTQNIDGNTTPDLVVINLGSRSINGVALTKTCRETLSEARVVGFCGHLETEIRRAAREAGIHKILTNEQAFTDLSNALSR
jgi:DNA-binding NarL/FixJ family response regulator